MKNKSNPSSPKFKIGVIIDFDIIKQLTNPITNVIKKYSSNKIP